jgi:alpha-amylase/alpha-mannosidase (GH57 family)
MYRVKMRTVYLWKILTDAPPMVLMDSQDMATVRLLFLWHMHQPFYKDLVTGEYRLPWVRLHALKDYYGMVKLLDEFPQVHQTFNLVPSLIVQIQDYVNGNAKDPFFRVASTPAGDLGLHERQFAIEYLFQANLQNMIGRYPRYRELWDQVQSASGNPAAAALFMKDRDFTDLQVLSQVAWFDEFWIGDAEVQELIRKGRNFSLADQQFVIRKQQDFLAQVLPAYAAAAQRGSIEISTSPFYHPILPLICDTNAGAVSHSGLPLPRNPFMHSDDAREQIVRGLDLHEQVFGVRPKGMWPSEGSVSNEVLNIAQELGLQWAATDEGVLGRSLGSLFHRDSGGHLTEQSAEALYRIYRFRQEQTHSSDTPLHMVFRDHSLSDLIGFVYSGIPAREAARDFINRIRESTAPLLRKGIDPVVPVILDGENAWEYYPESGREFLRCLYDAIEKEEGIEALTVSEAIAREKSPRELHSIFPGSWINANFDVWIGAPEDNLAWDYLSDAREFFNENAGKATPQQRKLAWEELLIAEGSDWNWWYGPEHHSANDRDFDELFRKHLTNVYDALGAVPPDVLAQPIIGSYAKPAFTPQTAYISPRVGNPNSGYFDWLGAATHMADRRSSAMHGKSFLLDTGYAGVDAENLYCRLDFMEKTSDWSTGETGLVVTIESQPEGENGSRKPASYRLEAFIAGDGIQRWSFSENGHNGPISEGVYAGLRREYNFECKIPLRPLGATPGTILRIRFSLWRDRLPLDALPQEGSIEVRAVSAGELDALAYAKP